MFRFFRQRSLNSTSADSDHAVDAWIAPTRASLLRELHRDLAVIGFTRGDKKLILKNAELTIELFVDVTHQAMDPTNPIRQVGITFKVHLNEPVLQHAPIDLPAFWIGTGWFSRYDILHPEGARELYLFKPGDIYAGSQLSKDVRDFGIDFFRGISEERTFLDYVSCRPIKMDDYTIERKLKTSRNALALSLVIYDAMDDKVHARESVEKLKRYDTISGETHKSMQALATKIAIMGELLKRYDGSFYESLVGRNE